MRGLKSLRLGCNDYLECKRKRKYDADAYREAPMDGEVDGHEKQVVCKDVNPSRPSRNTRESGAGQFREKEGGHSVGTG